MKDFYDELFDFWNVDDFSSDYRDPNVNDGPMKLSDHWNDVPDDDDMKWTFDDEEEEIEDERENYYSD